MVKKRIQLEDGRYLIYYSFPDGPPPRCNDGRADSGSPPREEDKPASRGRARV